MWLYVLTLRSIAFKDNPSVFSSSAVTNIYFGALPPSLPAAIVFISLCSTNGSFSLTHSLFASPSSSPRVHRGHKTKAAIQPLHASCAGWHHGDGGARVVACCCRLHLEGRESQQPHLLVSVTFSDSFWCFLMPISDPRRPDLLQEVYFKWKS